MACPQLRKQDQKKQSSQQLWAAQVWLADRLSPRRLWQVVQKAPLYLPPLGGKDIVGFLLFGPDSTSSSLSLCFVLGTN